MKKRMKKVATLCLAGVTAMSTVGVTGSAVFAKGDTNYDVDNMDCYTVSGSSDRNGFLQNKLRDLPEPVKLP